MALSLNSAMRWRLGRSDHGTAAKTRRPRPGFPGCRKKSIPAPDCVFGKGQRRRHDRAAVNGRFRAGPLAWSPALSRWSIGGDKPSDGRR